MIDLYSFVNKGFQGLIEKLFLCLCTAIKDPIHNLNIEHIASSKDLS